MIVRRIGDLFSGRRLLAIGPDAPCAEACDVMVKERVGALAVLSDGQLVGIISERDMIANWRQIAEARVGDVMTPDPVTVQVTDPLSVALDRMQAGGIRHLPVMRLGRPVAMISLRDIPVHYRMMHEQFDRFRYGAGGMAAE